MHAAYLCGVFAAALLIYFTGKRTGSAGKKGVFDPRYVFSSLHRNLLDGMIESLSPV
jgi:hypothetical protein